MKDEIKKALEGGTPGRWYWMKTIESNSHKWLQWQNERIEQLEKALEEIASYDKGLFENDYFEMLAIARKALGKEE